MKTKTAPVPLSDITLRDFFAVFAMQAIIGKVPLIRDDDNAEIYQEAIARGAYDYADSMMEERK